MTTRSTLPAGTAAAMHICGLLVELGEPHAGWPGYIYSRYVDGESSHGVQMTGGWPASHFRPLTVISRELLRLAKEGVR